MSTITLKLPETLHESARELAKKENISISQLITLALAEKLSALMTEDYLRERAGRADKALFAQALAKVPDVEPAECDRL